MIIPVKLASSSYDIAIYRGALSIAADVIAKKNRRILVVTDSGVPERYADELLALLGESAVLHIIPEGEENKDLETLQDVLHSLLCAGFTRSDAVVALGGGVVGDLAGFAAAIYMRGIDFYNIPTTLLAQVDSSVGGKTAVDLDGYKNMIGAFWQPRAVFIDPDLLSTLPQSHIRNGLCEALKMGATSDPELFALFEENDIDLEKIIARAVTVKRDIVQKDEREGGLRKVLNFGHTLGHAIESSSTFTFLHGECVALGMPPMCENEAVKSRLVRALENIGLPTDANRFFREKGALLEALKHDKKGASGGKISAVVLKDIGDFEFVEMTPEELIQRLEK